MRVEVVSNWSELQDAVASATASEDLSIIFSADIEIPDGVSLKTINNTDIEFEMQGHKLYSTRTAAKPGYAMLEIPAKSQVSIKDGVLELTGPGDASWAVANNTISVYGVLRLDKCKVVNNCSAGISSAIDNMGGVTTMTGGEIESGRYGVRVWTNSTVNESLFHGIGVKVTTSSSGLFLHQPSSGNPGYLGRFLMEQSIVTSPKGAIYIWDCSTVAGSGDNLKIELADTVVTSGDPSGDDKWVPGYEGIVTYDSSTVGGKDHIVVVVKETPKPLPMRVDKPYKHNTGRAAFPKFAFGRT